MLCFAVRINHTSLLLILSDVGDAVALASDDQFVRHELAGDLQWWVSPLDLRQLVSIALN